MNHKLILFILLLSSCSISRYSSTDFASQYQNLYIKPSYRCYIYSSDSASILYQFDRDGILFKRDENNQFTSDISISYLIFKDARSGELLDSGSTILHSVFDSLSNVIQGKIKLKMRSGLSYLIIKSRDINRQQEHIFESVIDNRIRGNCYQYNFTDNFGQELISNNLPIGSSINLTPPQGITKLTVRCYFDDFPFALPPFSNFPPALFDLHSDSSYQLTVAEMEGISFNRKGIYYFQDDTMSTSGFTVICTDEDFPVFTSTNQLIESLRYLTTRKEYEILKNSVDQKKAIDDFWLEKAGNNERGRKLIRVYYGRASDANLHFTSFMDGWKTDRGMIYIIFGPPSTVYKTTDTETWTYRYNQGLPACQFVFRKMLNPFSANDYVLQRSELLQRPWFIAVDTWRAGRIAGDE